MAITFTYNISKNRAQIYMNFIALVILIKISCRFYLNHFKHYFSIERAASYIKPPHKKKKARFPRETGLCVFTRSQKSAV